MSSIFALFARVKKPVEIQVIQDSELISLCSYICFKTFRFANSMDKISHCNVCKKFFPPGLPNSLFLYHNGFLLDFCCKICHNVFLLMRRKIVSCFWCKVKKYDHDMIEQTSAFSEFGGGCVIVCSIHCLTLYQVSLRTSTKRQLKCDWCSEFRLAQVNIIMSDTSTRHFCSYECATNFRGRHGEMPSIVPKKDKPNTEPLASESSTPSGDPNNVATSVDLPSASPTSEECSTTNTKLPETELALGDKKTVNSPTKCVRQIILKPPEPKSTTNKFAQCNPSTNDGECQTDEFLKYPPVLPIPVPIYVPFPVPVYGAPIFVPIKIPQPYRYLFLYPLSKKTYQSIILQKKITPADSNNGSIMKDRVLAVTGEHRLENCSSESDDHIDNYPADGAPVEFSSLSQDDSENFTQTEKLVLNKSIAEILHNFDQESEEERATQDRVVDSEVEEASNVIRVRPETQTKDDGGKVCQLVKMDIDEKPDKTLKTNQKTENKCTTQNSVVEVEAKPVSASLEPLAQTKGDGEKVSEIWKPIVKDFVKTMRSLPKPKHENAIQITDESVSKPSSNLMRPGIQIKDDGEETPDRTVELGRKILNKEPSKIMPTQQKTENKHATSNPDDELERIKQESYSSNPFKPCSEKSQQQKRKSESTEGPSISKKSRPEHSASTKSENRQISKALPLTKASCSSMVEAKQANAGPSISIKSRPGHVTSRKSEYNQISKSLPLTNVSSSSIVEAKQAFVGPSVSKKSRPEHSTSTKSVNRQLFKSPPLTNVSSSSVVEAKQVNVGPSISKKSRPEHSTSTKSENRLISKSLPLTNVSSSSTVEVKQADADPPLSLKVSEGLSVWKKWLTATNTKIKIHAYLKKKVPKVFSTNILKLTIGELNYLLCRFVREIRQPNGTEYAADYIYYLCLCIQRYLFENGCIHNIFVESSYQPFVDALDKVARKFSQCSLTGAVEEELLWECEQLGGHSPYILVATLLFFNTKFFKLFTVEEHMRLSFSSITRMKKRCSSSSPSSNRTVVVRFSPPSALGAPKSQSKTYYDVREDRENVLRCPVRLYEFYLSKCHASVRQRNDVFYLQPVGNCPPDCPVWFSTAPLSKDVLVTMLHRIQMVKEINKPRLAS